MFDLPHARNEIMAWCRKHFAEELRGQTQTLEEGDRRDFQVFRDQRMEELLQPDRAVICSDGII